MSTDIEVNEAAADLSRRLTRDQLLQLAEIIEQDGIEVKPAGTWRLLMAGKELAEGEGMQSIALEHANVEDATGLSIVVYHGSDDGVPVVQIDGDGRFRVNVNDAPIWDADPNNHQHEQCRCAKDEDS